MIKKKTLFFVFFMLLGIVLFSTSVYNSGIDNIFKVLSEFSLIKFLFLVVISFLNFYLYSLRWELIVKSLFQEKKISTFTFFWDRMAAYAISYVTPMSTMGGEPLRILLLEEEGIPKKVGTSSVIIDKALETSTLIIFVSSGILVGLLDPRMDVASKIPMGIGAFAMLFLVFWFYYTSIKGGGFFSTLFRMLHLRKIRKIAKFEEKLNGFESEMNRFYKTNPKILKVLVVISLFTVLFILLEHFLVAFFMGVHLSFMQVFLTSTIPYFAYLLPVPGGLGVLESGHAAVFLVLGVSINAFAFVFIIRLRDFIFVLFGLIRGWHRGLKIMRKEYREEFDNPSQN
jgi:uncharacterized protein (TIRG00374 family)